MEWTPQAVVALVAGAGTLIGALGAFVQSFRSHRKLDEIHVKVNSRLDKALDEIQVLRDWVDTTRREAGKSETPHQDPVMLAPVQEKPKG